MKKILILFVLGLSMTGCYTQMAVNDRDKQEYQDYYAANDNSEPYSGDEGIVYDTVYYDDDEYIDSEDQNYTGLENKLVSDVYIVNPNIVVADPFWDNWNTYWRIQASWSPIYYFDGFLVDWWYPRPIVYSPYWDPFWNPYWDPYYNPWYNPYYDPYWGCGYYPGGGGGTITKTHPGHTRNNDGGRNSGERTRRIKEIKEISGGTDIAGTRNRNDRGTVSRNDDKRVSRERDILNDRNISINRIKKTGLDRTDVTTNRDRNVTTNRNDGEGTGRTQVNVRKDTGNKIDRDVNTSTTTTQTRTTNTNDRQRKTIYVKRENTNTNTKNNNKTDREYQRYNGQTTNNGSTSRTNTNTNTTTERKRETRNDSPQVQNTQAPVRNDYTPPVRNDGGNRSSGNSGNSGGSSRNSGNSGNRGRR